MSVKWTFIFALLPASQLQAQAGATVLLLRDSSARTIMAHVSRTSYPSWLIDIMRAAHGPVARGKLDEIADSLVARAIAGPTPDEVASGNWTQSAADALASAGDRSQRRGTPYTGALDRLIRVHQQAHSFTIRTGALAAMLGVVGRDRGLAYLKAVASSEDPTAWYAVNVLIIDANGGRWYGPKPSSSESRQSEALLRALYQSGSVRDNQAKRLLEEWVRHKAS